nr:hypothetical protein [Tanacetum cinerariifolium]
MNMSLENKAHCKAEKEAIHLILTGIGDEIYSTVDACQTAQEMWEAIERLQQGESLNIQDVKTNLFWEFGKEIAKPITPPSETTSKEDIDPEQAQRDKDIQKNLALIAKYFKKIYKPTNNNLQTSSNSRNKNVDTTPREKVGSPVVQQFGIRCFNCKEFGDFAKESRKPKRVKDSTYQKEKMLLCKQAEQDVPLQAEQYDRLADTDEEVDEQELEAHYNYMAKIKEVPTADTCTDSKPVEQDAIQNEQNDDERVALANLKLDVDENKKIQKQLKKANTTLAQDIKECKTILAETSKSLGSLLVFEIVSWLHFRPCRLSLRSIRPLMTVPLTMTNLNNDSFKFVHELKQEMLADLKYVEFIEKEIDELESDKAEFSNMYDVILQKCVSNDVKCSYLMSLSDLDVLDELQCLYLHKISNTLYNAIMEAGGKDRPPMLASDKDVQVTKVSSETTTERFVTLVKKSQELKTVSYHKLYDILKQHQNEVNEIRAERLARTANPLALVAHQQPVYHPQNHPKQLSTLLHPYMIKNLLCRANQDNSLRISRGTGYDNQRIVNVVGARETVGTTVVQKSGIQCYNCKEYRHVAKECQKLKRAKDAAYHKGKMLLCNQVEARFQLNAEQADWKDDTDDEPKD